MLSKHTTFGEEVVANVTGCENQGRWWRVEGAEDAWMREDGKAEV